jgi:prevent-host-death family protein
MAEMGAARFKAHCLQVMDRVSRTRQEVVITKRGIPVVKVVPIPPKKPFRLGVLQDEFEIVGDITRPLHTEEQWAAWRREKLDRFKTGTSGRGRQRTARSGAHRR